MSPPEQWRFQWPDGTWIRWNPETEAWEKEIAGAEGEEPRAETFDIAPEERWLLDSLEPTSEPVAEETGAGSISAEITVGPEFAISTEPTDDADHSDDDGDDDWDDEDDDEIALGPRRAAAHVIAEEEPKSSLRPTIIAGAGVGIAVGIVVSMLLR